MPQILLATVTDIGALAPLFDQYRVFYEQTSNLDAAKSFITARIINNESVIFLAIENAIAVGFTQLYPSFSSVSMQPIYILNDLYVTPQYRGSGVGKALLEKAKEHCRSKGYKGLALETAIDNPAQKLYEKLGWIKDTQCFHYFYPC